MKMTKKTIEKICNRIYNELGPYQIESTYGNAMEYELIKEGITYNRELPIPILYDKHKVGHGVVDFFIDGKYLLEFKANTSCFTTKEGKSSNAASVIKSKNQVIRYLIALNLETGYLINFNIGGKAGLEIELIINPELGDE